MPVAWDQKCVCGDTATYHDDRPGLSNGGACCLCDHCDRFAEPALPKHPVSVVNER